MARHRRNEIATHDFAKHMVTLLDQTAEAPTAKTIELWIARNHDVHVSEESIRKALRGEVDPTACDVMLLAGLTGYFEVAPEALGSFAARRLAAVLAMVGGPDTHDDLPQPASTCMPSATVYSFPRPGVSAAAA